MEQKLKHWPKLGKITTAQVQKSNISNPSVFSIRDLLCFWLFGVKNGQLAVLKPDNGLWCTKDWLIFQILNYHVSRKNAEDTLLCEVAFAVLTVFYLVLLSTVIGSNSNCYPNDPSNVIGILTMGSFVVFFYYKDTQDVGVRRQGPLMVSPRLTFSPTFHLL